MNVCDCLYLSVAAMKVAKKAATSAPAPKKATKPKPKKKKAALKKTPAIHKPKKASKPPTTLKNKLPATEEHVPDWRALQYYADINLTAAQDDIADSLSDLSNNTLAISMFEVAWQTIHVARRQVAQACGYAATARE